MNPSHVFKLNSRYQHPDPLFGVGVYNVSARIHTKQENRDGEVYLDFPSGMKPVSIQYLRPYGG